MRCSSRWVNIRASPIPLPVFARRLQRTPRPATPPLGGGSGLSAADLSWAGSIVGIYALDEPDRDTYHAISGLAARLRTAAAAVKNLNK